jgi:hypothetical protein
VCLPKLAVLHILTPSATLLLPVMMDFLAPSPYMVMFPIPLVTFTVSS